MNLQSITTKLPKTLLHIPAIEQGQGISVNFQVPIQIWIYPVSRKSKLIKRLIFNDFLKYMNQAQQLIGYSFAHSKKIEASMHQFCLNDLTVVCTKLYSQCIESDFLFLLLKISLKMRSLKAKGLHIPAVRIRIPPVHKSNIIGSLCCYLTLKQSQLMLQRYDQKRQKCC